MRMRTLMASALAALTLPISLAALGAGYLACYMEYTGKASASCYIPSINATYSCALTAGAPLCFTRQEEELPCLYVLNRPGELPEVSCMAAIPRATPPRMIHVTIDDARFGGPGKPQLRTVRKVESWTRRPTRLMTDAPTRTIPTIGDLMRPPPPPPVTQQDIEDALEAAATSAAAAETAAAAANAASQAAAQAAAQQQAVKDQELHCRPDYIGGVVCRPR